MTGVWRIPVQNHIQRLSGNELIALKQGRINIPVTHSRDRKGIPMRFLQRRGADSARPIRLVHALTLLSMLCLTALVAILCFGARLTTPFAWADEAERLSSENAGADAAVEPLSLSAESPLYTTSLESLAQTTGSIATAQAEKAASFSNFSLSYDPALIAAVGNQEASGHWGCCPSYACAYGDAILYGTATSHTYYGCKCCTWPGWGGGDSSFRSLGSDAALLKEAYDSIAAGAPTVIHVRNASTEHWVCLIGYRNVVDPESLSLDNFIALDPVDGAEFVVSERYWLYGDACEHVSETL